MTIYTDNGYTNRKEYLNELREEYGELVNILTTVLPASEDFDGLISALEDAMDSGEYDDLMWRFRNWHKGSWNAPHFPYTTFVHHTNLMGTRSRIGIELPDHSVVSVYCHWDGYVDHNGRILVEHYMNREDVKALIDGGSMSSLLTRGTWTNGPTLKDENGEYILDSQGHIMSENDREPQPLYYSERGEDEPPTMTSFDEFISGNSGEEYAYLYDLNDNWKAFKINYKGPVERLNIPSLVTA